jgi:hypothetical protein
MVGSVHSRLREVSRRYNACLRQCRRILFQPHRVDDSPSIHRTDSLPSPSFVMMQQW